MREFREFINHPSYLQCSVGDSWAKVQDQSRTNGPINAHLTIAQVKPRYNHKNEKQEALL